MYVRWNQVQNTGRDEKKGVQGTTIGRESGTGPGIPTALNKEVDLSK